MTTGNVNVKESGEGRGGAGRRRIPQKLKHEMKS